MESTNTKSRSWETANSGLPTTSIPTLESLTSGGTGSALSESLAACTGRIFPFWEELMLNELLTHSNYLRPARFQADFGPERIWDNGLKPKILLWKMTLS